MVEVSASILSVKKENAIQTLYNLEVAKIDYFHIDVMDGEFVKNNTIDQMLEYCEYLSSISTIPLDVHLMVKDVKSYITSFSVFEPNIITFHLEAAKNKQEVMEWITLIKENHCRVGISIKPNTALQELYEYLPYIHLILVMTVEPGEGGQKLIESTISKIENLKKYIEENALETQIEVDGGIQLKNAEVLKQAGADILVSGSGILNSENYEKTVKELKV